ncbi:hypothetical protein QBC35DRAFT_515814 [Podospora australis]|uniref:SMP domain-containing protein n=1 Tax=Podospora australis TaxID=1536484 RepID=A0AAN6WS05_9PEZI|nr:hypothetical protein QBC35DRAFT_515814 [Podospora australis]
MDSELPSKEQLATQAVDGRPITQSAAATIAAAESDMTGRGPIKGGPAATAQSLHDRQENFLAAADEVAHKNAEEITKEDAAKVQHFEARALGHPGGKDSFGAHVQSIADHNAQTKASEN